MSTHALDAFTHKLGRTWTDDNGWIIPANSLFINMFVGSGEHPRTTGVAEGVGFEPTLGFPLNTLSKRAP